MLWGTRLVNEDSPTRRRQGGREEGGGEGQRGRVGGGEVHQHRECSRYIQPTEYR